MLNDTAGLLTLTDALSVAACPAPTWYVRRRAGLTPEPVGKVGHMHLYLADDIIRFADEEALRRAAEPRGRRRR